MRLLFLTAVALLFVGFGAKAQSGCAWTLYQDGYYRSYCGGYWYLASGNQVYVWTSAGWQLTSPAPSMEGPGTGDGGDDFTLPDRYNNYDPSYNPRPEEGDRYTNLNPAPING